MSTKSLKEIAAETLARHARMRAESAARAAEERAARECAIVVPSLPHGQTATATPSGWREALARIDPGRPPDGTPPERWRQLITDAQWLAQTHGEAAHALGWQTSALFGLARYDGEGGLADRLAGARSLRFTNTAAHWRRVDGDELLTVMIITRSMRTDMAPLWEWCP